MNRKLYIVLFIVLFGSADYLHAQTEADHKISVRIPVSTKKALLDLPAPIFRENLRNDSLDLEIDFSEFESLKERFPGLKLLPASIMLDNSDMAKDLEEALTLTKYPTYFQYDSMMHYFAERYPDICMIDTFGRSIEGRLLLALKISDNVESEEDEPAFLYTATIHGDELVGYILTLRLIDFILKNYGSNTEINRIVDNVELWINPLSNPDATFYPNNDLSVVNSRRYNTKNIDLNRNFPNINEADDTSRVQLENQYMMLFLRDKKFNISANLHSGAEVVNYPWDYTHKRHPDSDWLVLISQEYADEARSTNPGYMDDFVDDSTGITGISEGADWYSILGGRQDYVTYFLKGRELTLELSNRKHIESESLDTYWIYNKWSMINLISQSMYGIHGNVSSRNTGELLRAKINVKDHDNEISWVESDSISGNFYRYLKEGNYDLIISSEGYNTDTISGVEVIDFEKTELTILLDSIGSGIEKKHVVRGLKAYPNPSSDQLILSVEKPFRHTMITELFNSMGRQVGSELWKRGTDKLEFDVSELSSGFYILRISGDAEIYHLKIVVE